MWKDLGIHAPRPVRTQAEPENQNILQYIQNLLEGVEETTNDDNDLLRTRINLLLKHTSALCVGSDPGVAIRSKRDIDNALQASTEHRNLKNFGRSSRKQRIPFPKAPPLCKEQLVPFEKLCKYMNGSSRLRPLLTCILGGPGTGKSSIAQNLANRFPVPLILSYVPHTQVSLHHCLMEILSAQHFILVYQQRRKSNRF